MNNNIKKLWQLINESENIVFFGGAGTSTESGIPDFRSATGLYSTKYENIPPEEILSYNFMMTNQDLFFEYITKYLIHPDAEPNTCHNTLVELEKEGKLKAVITQNIDNLHQKAGSKNVLELHGTVYKNYCYQCGKKYTLEEVLARESESKPTPICDECNSFIRPDVVLYGESLNSTTIIETEKVLHDADLLIVGGTSLTVYPAAAFIRYFKGQNLVIINKTETPYNNEAVLVINESLGAAFNMKHR